MTIARKRLSAAVLSALQLASPVAFGTTLTDVPIAVKNTVVPNVMFTLDDSGSMQFEVIPESDDVFFTFPRPATLYGAGWGYGGSFDTTARFELSNRYARYFRSARFNSLYYDPTRRYQPWSKEDGTLFPDSPPTAACHNPYRCPSMWPSGTAPSASNEGTLNLTTNQTWNVAWRDDDGSENTASRTYYPATYFNYIGAAPHPTSPTDAANTAAKFGLVEIKPGNAPFPKAAGRTDCVASASSCSYNEEIQNFANWYTYYRSRILTARAGTGRAFSKQGTGMRVGFAAINKAAATLDGISTRTIVSGVRAFSGSGRTSFFSSLYDHPMPAAGTPLRQALDDVGQYFKRTDDRGPWGENPGSTGGTQYACRQNYNILMTDGYWNGNSAATAGARSNVDNTSGATMTPPAGSSLSPFTYTPANPYKDSVSSTLADVAMYYWVNDLRSDMANKIVPPNPKDPAFWQHLVNFTVGLGVYGTIPKTTIESAFSAINATPPTTPPTIDWPTPCDGCTTQNVDDLAHAALNSRGNYFSAADPDAFAASLTDALDDIVARSGAAAAVAVANANITGGDNSSYASSYNSGTWTGDLDSFAVDVQTGVPSTTSSWTSGSGQTQLDLRTHGTALATALPTDRAIVTYSGSGYSNSGLQFQPAATAIGGSITSKLSTAQQNRLNTPSTTDGSSVLAYLRGDRSGETAGTYRSRAHLLGDIINAEPVVIRSPSNFFIDSGYSAFKTAQSGRTKIVVQPANDGMVHMFNGTTGAENWAYIPNLLLDTSDPASSSTSVLNLLSRKTYSHRMFIDATPFVGDADLNNTDGMSGCPSSCPTPDWRTIAIGGLGKGGRGIYALDMTTPTASSEANAASKVLWEFPNASTDATVKANIGYIFGRPFLVKTKAKGWVVLVASGYNNGTGTDNSGGNGHGYLFVLNARTGELIKAIDTTPSSGTPVIGTAANPSGLAHLAPFVKDASYNNEVTQVYGGDLLGNLWRFDISDASITNWNVKRLAVLKDGAGAGAGTQPVTSEPQLALVHLGGGVYKRFIYVGTGQYLGDPDVTNSQTQTVYGLIDDLSSPTDISPVIADNLRNSLQQQSLTDLGTGKRTASNNAVSYTGVSAKKGWYVDLPDPSTAPSERVNTHPALVGGAIIFTSNIPSPDPCIPGGSSWLTVLDYKTGGALAAGTNTYSSVSLGNVLASRPIVIKTSTGIKALVRTSEGKTITEGTGIPTPTPVGKRAAWREILK